jgi:hypothetical protein
MEPSVSLSATRELQSLTLGVRSNLMIKRLKGKELARLRRILGLAGNNLTIDALFKRDLAITLAEKNTSLRIRIRMHYKVS